MDKQIELLKKELNSLKLKFLIIEKMYQRDSGGFEIKVLVLDKDIIKLRIDANKNHARPHIHVDYGKHFHAASISIDTSDLMIGTVPNLHLKEIKIWVTKNKELLLSIWNALRNSENPDSYILSLEST